MTATQIEAPAKLREHGFISYSSATIGSPELMTVVSGGCQCSAKDGRRTLLISGIYRSTKGIESESLNVSIARASEQELRKFAKRHGISIS